MESLCEQETREQLAIVVSTVMDLVDHAVRIADQVQAIQAAADALQSERIKMKAFVDGIHEDVMRKGKEKVADGAAAPPPLHPLAKLLRRFLEHQSNSKAAPSQEPGASPQASHNATRPQSQHNHDYQALACVLALATIHLNRRVQTLVRREARVEAGAQHEAAPPGSGPTPDGRSDSP